MATLSGGSKLMAYLATLSASVPKAAAVDVGFMEGSTDAEGVSNALKAAFNEYGVPSKGQPPRPFFRRTIADRADAWGHNLGVALVRTDFDARAALSLVGEGMVGDVQKGINDLVDPPLAASTIAAKGFDKPLIDKGDMLRAVTKRVR